MQHTAARSQPASRAGIAPGPAAWATGRMNVSSAAVAPTAAWAETDPAKRTTKAATAMPATAATGYREHRVPRVMSTRPVAVSPTYERRRTRVGPPKSANRSNAKVPNTAMRVACGLPQV